MSSLLGMNGGEASPPGIDLKAGLVAHYLLNNNADDSHGTDDGVSSSGVTFQGDVATFDGLSGSIATTQPLENHQVRTYSFWVRPSENQLEEVVQLFSFGTLTFNFSHSYLHPTLNGQISLNDGNSTWQGVGSGNAVMVAGELYNIIVVVNDTVIDVYLNTLLVGHLVWNGTYSSTLQPLVIGSSYDGLSFFFNGEITNFRIYNDAKNTDFVQALFEEGYYPKPLSLPTTVGLLAHYPLTGTAEDTTGNYDGVEVGNTYVDDAEYGSVANFDGVNDYINTNLALLPTSESVGTISLWVYPTAHAGFILGSNRISGGASYILLSSFLIRYGNGVSVADINPSLVLNTWSNLTVVLRGSSGGFAVYVNGIFIAERLTALYDGHSFPLFIGSRNVSASTDVPTSFFGGKVLTARFYNRILTVQEIIDIYNYEKNFRPVDIDDGLIAYYPCAKNSLDNYYNEYDGVDTSVTYDGTQATIVGNITFPPAIGFVEMYYIQHGVKQFTTTEINVFNAGTLKDVRKYNKALTAEQKLVIGY